MFDLLHAWIVAGKYAPGDWLRQEEIARQFSVSQTPVREALDHLVSVGLAERVPYRGVRVPLLEAETILDAYALRLILEGVIARLASQNITPPALQNLSEMAERMQELISLEHMSALRQLNRSFHLTIAQASGNALLNHFYEMVSNIFPDWRLYEYMFRHPELLESSLEQENQEHLAIVAAIAAGDSELAVQHTVQHVKNLGKELQEYLGIPGELLVQREAQIQSLG